MQDIWHHICSFLPLKDAARAARASRVFQHSWRRHPNLTFSKETMGLKENASEILGFKSSEARRSEMITRDYNNRVGNILKKHSGSVKTLKLELYGPYNADTSHCIDSWLKIAVTPGIEELTLIVNSHGDQLLDKAKYNFPCSILCNESVNSIRALDFLDCAFHPTEGLGCMRSLTSLSLNFVHITGDELGFLLSNSLALEILELIGCNEIISIQIPCLLQRLSCLTVSDCEMLQVIDSKAPNISRFTCHLNGKIDLLLGESLRVKEVNISHP
jgi:hypothetical protein